jgi:hypothetical protein
MVWVRVDEGAHAAVVVDGGHSKLTRATSATIPSTVCAIQENVGVSVGLERFRR